VTVCVWGGGGQIWSPLGGGVGDGADRVASRAGGGGGGGRAGVPCDRVAWGARVLHVFNPSSMLLALNFSSVA